MDNLRAMLTEVIDSIFLLHQLLMPLDVLLQAELAKRRVNW